MRVADFDGIQRNSIDKGGKIRYNEYNRYRKAISKRVAARQLKAEIHYERKMNMKKTNNNSPMKRIAASATMLAVSAAMLGTSTYAWFTMNKTVEVKGLKMQATASSGLEISLGALGTAQDTNAISVDSPSKNDISWKRQILVSDYYATVGMLKPASSDDALDIFRVPEAKVYAGGHAVEANATISEATQGDSVSLTLQDISNKTDTLATVDTAGTDGYYIDIPMWIRTSNQDSAGTPVYATVTITDPDTTNGSALIKAVRVAIIPTAQASAESTMAIGNASSAYVTDATTASTITPVNAAPNASAAASIFGLKANGVSAAMDTNTAINWPTYHDGKVINATGAYKVSGDSGVTLGSTTLKGARGAGETGVTATNVFTIPSATADDYGRVGFVARVWLEGESIYCEDATANQDWNIDFYFSTESTALTDYTAP